MLTLFYKIVQRNKKSHSSFSFHQLVLHGTPNCTVQLWTKMSSHSWKRRNHWFFEEPLSLTGGSSKGLILASKIKYTTAWPFTVIGRAWPRDERSISSLWNCGRSQAGRRSNCQVFWQSWKYSSSRLSPFLLSVFSTLCSFTDLLASLHIRTTAVTSLEP